MGRLKVIKYLCLPRKKQKKIFYKLIATLSNSTLSVSINSKGAELISFRNNQTKREYIWEGNPEYWGKHSPILFPIVGTLKNNSYRFNGQNYTLPRHGFARDYEFKLISQEPEKVVFSLQENTATLAVYPFNFELQVGYTLTENEVIVSYLIKNNNQITMPFSIGGHPAFALKNAFTDYSLRFEKEENLISYALENDLISDKTAFIQLQQNELPLSYSLFENDALVFKNMASKQIQLLENNIPILNFKYCDFPHFGLWTKVGAQFICLEPWLGYADTVTATGNLTEKEGITLLEGNSAKEIRFSVEIV
jgi:galactose mutarotase-like enzyme